MAGTMEKDNLIELTAEIVSAYVSSQQNRLRRSHQPDQGQSTRLCTARRQVRSSLEAEPLKPAVAARSP